MHLAVQLAINTLALLIVAYIIPGFIIADLWTAVVAAVIMGVANTFVKPILVLITLPITVLTLGIFLFVINVVLLLLVARVVPGFEITGLGTAIVASIALALVSWFLHRLAQE